jgi:hypothetical protein
MKCESCGIQIDGKFSHAIKNNQCPACGKELMQKAKLASYLSLCALLQENCKNVDAEHVATLIVANFEIKQIFQNDLKSPRKECTIEVAEGEASAEEEDEGPDEVVTEDGIKLSKINKGDAQKMLQQMRDDALNGAMSERYGVENGQEGIFMSENSYEERSIAEQQSKRDAIISGTSGSFSRS